MSKSAAYKMLQVFKDLGDMENFAEHLVMGYRMGIISYPRQLYLYRRAIELCINGVSDEIEDHITNVQNEYDGLFALPPTDPKMAKWRESMLQHYATIVYVLTFYRDLFNQLHPRKDVMSNGTIRSTSKVSSKVSNSSNRESNTVVCSPRISTVKHHRKPKTEII